MADGLKQEDIQSLTEKAYQAISDAISRLELKPGTTLTQERLARWLSISRTPVREALRRLEQEGVIRTAPGRGLIVGELTAKDVEDLLEMLHLTDTRATLLAAQRRTPEQGAKLVEIAHALLGAAQHGDHKGWTQIDKGYHETLLDAAGNAVLRQTVLDVRRRLHRVTYNVAVDAAFMLSGTHEHIAIAEAIAAGEPDRAAEAMQTHLDAVSAHALTLVRNYIVPIHGERF